MPLEVADIADVVADALRPLLARIEALEKREPVVMHGRDGVPGANGRDGRDGKDGVSVTAADLAPVVADLVAKAVAAIPPAKDGAPGRDGKDGERGADGKDADPTDVADLVCKRISVNHFGLRDTLKGERGEIGQKGDPGLKGDPGERGEKGQPGDRGEQGPQGLQGLAGDRGERGERGEKGIDGVSLGLEHVQHVGDYDPETGIAAIVLTDGVATKRVEFRTPWLVDCGVYEHGKTYRAGSVVSFGGSMWAAQKDTSAKPGLATEDSRAWRLIVKGAQGKTGPQGPPGPEGPRGPQGPVGRL